jgi:ribosome biogenesis protein BMS1
MVGKGHSKKKGGRKKEKKKAAAQSTFAGDTIDTGIKESNPRDGQLASKGKARVQRARTAEKEQRRLHGAAFCPRFRMCWELSWPHALMFSNFDHE